MAFVFHFGPIGPDPAVLPVRKPNPRKRASERSRTKAVRDSSAVFSLEKTPAMPAPASLSSASAMLRHRLLSALRTRGGGASGPSRWTTPGHEERPKGYPFNRTPPPPGQSRKWEDWELPCYITSFLTIVILGVGLNAKPDLTIESWAHEKALERLKMENLGLSNSGSGESD